MTATAMGGRREEDLTHRPGDERRGAACAWAQFQPLRMEAGS